MERNKALFYNILKSFAHFQNDIFLFKGMTAIYSFGFLSPTLKLHLINFPNILCIGIILSLLTS